MGSNAPLSFIWGHPVPYSLTVQRNGRSIGAQPHLEAVRDYLHQWVPDREMIITKVEGAYVWYDYMPEGWVRPRFSVAAIDVGFDIRFHPEMVIEYPIEGPVLLNYDIEARGTGGASVSVTRKCDSRAEALRVLRRHGYRIIKRREAGDNT